MQLHNYFCPIVSCLFYGHDPWIITLCFIHIISSSFFLLAVRHGLTGTKKIWRATAIFDGVRARSIMPLTFGIQVKKNWLVLLFDPHARIMNMPLNIIIGEVKKEKTDYIPTLRLNFKLKVHMDLNVDCFWFSVKIASIFSWFCFDLYSIVQINLFQKHLFLHQLTHNMSNDCPLIYKFSTWKLQAQNMLCT